MTSLDTTDRTSTSSLASLCARAGVRQVGGRPITKVEITALVDDSREVTPGSCFVAIRGTVADGHRYVDAAVRAGAVAVIVNADADVAVSEPAAVVRVCDTREALARLAAAYHGVISNGRRPRGGANELRLVGITGTNGKSTVAWLLRSILDAAGESAALIGTIEYDLSGRREKSDLTTPSSLTLCHMLASARRSGARYGVVEVSSHALEQRRCDGLTFDAVVFTNLSGDHLDYHGSMESYFVAKRRLFELSDSRSVGVVNIDDAYGARLAACMDMRMIRYALDSEHCDVRAAVEGVTRTGSDIVMALRSGPLPVRTRLIGRHNVANALAAAAVAEALGIAPDMIRRGVESVGGVPGRLQRVEPDDCPFGVLVDYAHTDAALDNVLTALRPLTSGRLICVFGCGGNRDRTKRPRMAGVVERLADVAFVTSDNPRTEEPGAIIDEILPGFGAKPRCRIEVDADRRVAITAAIAQAKPGDTVLIAGKGHEDYQIVGDERLHFDDAEIARTCLKTRSAQEVSA